MAPKPQDRIGHICRMQKDSTSSINDPILTDNMLLVLAPAGEDAAYMWVAPITVDAPTQDTAWTLPIQPAGPITPDGVLLKLNHQRWQCGYLVNGAYVRVDCMAQVHAYRVVQALPVRNLRGLELKVEAKSMVKVLEMVGRWNDAKAD